MAINTENKRRSVQGYGGVFMPPRPDGTINTPDREHVAWLYAGITASDPTTASEDFVVVFHGRKILAGWGPS